MSVSEVVPNFLIVGAAKCGTTSLAEYLKGHSEAFVPEIKEPNYFAYPEINEAKAKSWEEYIDLFRPGGDRKAIGEASVHYLFMPESPARIWKALGEQVKIVAILRNPADMMYSLWMMRLRLGFEYRNARKALLSASFDIKVDAEVCKNAKSIGRLYAMRADYAGQLKRYLDIFPRENIKVFIFEEFFRPGLPMYGELCGFLDISAKQRPEESVHNKGTVVRSGRVNNFVNNIYPEYVYPLAKRITPQFLRSGVRDALMRLNSRGAKPLDSGLRAELESKMNHTVRNLEGLLERDLSRVWF